MESIDRGRGVRTRFGVGKLLALSLSAMLFLGALVSVQTAPAQAASGSLESLGIQVLFDGAKLPNDVDDDPQNGVVATRDVVGFQWDLTAIDLRDGEFTQTLPEGWAWDPTSFAALDTAGSVYQASHELSADGRTVVARVSIGEGGGTAVISLSGMKAIPGRGLANGSVYTPVLTGSDGGATLTAQAEPVEVRGLAKINMHTWTQRNNARVNYDFGDGAGPVAARATEFNVRLMRMSDGDVGVLDFDLQQPAVIENTLEVAAPYADTKFTAEIVSKGRGNPTVTQNGNRLTLTLEGYPVDSPRSGNVELRLRLLVADSALPPEKQVKVKSTVVAPNLTTTNGDSVQTHVASVTAEGWVQVASGVGSAAHEKRILRQNDPARDPGVFVDPISSDGGKYAWADRANSASGSIIVPRLRLAPGADLATGKQGAITDLIAYDFWEPDGQQLIEGAPIFVGQERATASLPASEYSVQYTTGSDRKNPESNTWVETIDEAGGVENVSGIRIAYTSGAWGGEPATQTPFVVAFPLKLVAKQGTIATDYSVFGFTDAAGKTSLLESTNWVRAVDAEVRLAKTVSKSTIVGGAPLEYTLKPSIVVPSGATETQPVNGVKIVDQLPARIVSVDTSNVDPLWKVTREGAPATGLTLTFEYVGEAKTNDALPEIQYSAVTSVYAPTGTTFVNRATIYADGAQPVERRVTSSYMRAQVVSSEKLMLGDESVQPGDTARFETRWYNFQTTTQGESYFVDVLPFNGDGRGTDLSGTVTLQTAELTNARGEIAPDGYAKLQYTTADPALVMAAQANDDSFNWQDATATDFSAIDGITAVRAVVKDFTSGENGMGGLKVSLSGSDWAGGDRLESSSKLWLGASKVGGTTNQLAIDVVTSSVAGTVWEDSDGNGERDLSEPVLPGVMLTLLDAAGGTVATTVSGADGSYQFAEMVSGDYRVRADESTLAFPDTSVVTNTFDLSGGGSSDSGVLAVGKDTAVQGADFGYLAESSVIALSKYGAIATEAVPGELVEWTFDIENAGEATLEQVEIADHLDETSAPVIEWPGEPGVLREGETARATATTVLTRDHIDAGSIVNEATVRGTNVNGVTVEADATASVTLPEGASLRLEKSGELVGEAVNGGEALWSFVLTNTGNVTLSGLDLIDELDGIETVTWGDWPGASGTLRAGETVTAYAKYRLTQADVDAAKVENTAVASGKSPGGQEVSSGDVSATLTLDPHSSLTIVKRTNGERYDAAPGAAVNVGDDVEWMYEVTNAGATTLTNVAVNDDQEGQIAAPSGFSGVLAPGESVTLTLTGVASLGQYTNVGTATATTLLGDHLTASDASWYTGATKPVPPVADTGSVPLTGLAIAAAVIFILGLFLLLRKRN